MIIKYLIILQREFKFVENGVHIILTYNYSDT